MKIKINHQLCLLPEVHLYNLHRAGAGYISIAQKAAKWNEKYYNQSEMLPAVNDWSGNDIYTSQNSFTTKRRTLMNIECLENLYVDIDCYKEGFTVEHALGSVEYLADNEDIPYPNMIVMSGRGLQVIWNITPEPSGKIPMWQEVENWLCGELKHLGADSNSTDVSRVLRLCGSYHSVNGNMVHSFDYHNEPYKLEELYEQLIRPIPAQPQKERKAKGNQSNLKRIFTLHSLFWNRLQDIWHLITIRNGECEGSREIILFLYRYHSCCFTSDPEQSLSDTLELNSRFKKPLTEKEVITATRSAERAYHKNKLYKYKTQKIVEILEITEEEQREMKNLIGTAEKRRRKNIKRVKHVNKGKYEKVINAYTSGTTGIKALSRETGVSIDTVRKYIKEYTL